MTTIIGSVSAISTATKEGVLTGRYQDILSIFREIDDIAKIRLAEENSMKLFGFLFPCIAPALSVTLFQSVEVELSRLE